MSARKMDLGRSKMPISVRRDFNKVTLLGGDGRRVAMVHRMADAKLFCRAHNLEMVILRLAEVIRSHVSVPAIKVPALVLAERELRRSGLLVDPPGMPSLPRGVSTVEETS